MVSTSARTVSGEIQLDLDQLEVVAEDPVFDHVRHEGLL
jgi:hypothetical protein